MTATANDAPLDGHLRELASAAQAELDAIYVHCDGNPPDGERTTDRIVAYLHAHAIAPAAFFISTRWRSVAQIRAESALREGLQGVLDDQIANPTAPAPEVARDALRALTWSTRPRCAGRSTPQPDHRSTVHRA